MIKSPMVTLNSGVQMPALGFGVFNSNGDEAVHAVSKAIEIGYRLIDTAAAYGNEEQVGQAIRQSGVHRSELFITTKLFLADYGYEQALHAFDVSRRKLGVDYVDLYLLHWPVPRAFDATLSSWRALEKLLDAGDTRAIGVCNFNPDHLDALVGQSEVKPALNQVELHPYFSQRNVRLANTNHNVHTQAWSPIGGVKRYWAKEGAAVHDPLRDKVIAMIAEKYGRTPAQVVLRWHIEHGTSPIPKSSRAERIAENFDVFDFRLTPEEVIAIDLLNCNERGGPDPEVNDLAAIRARLSTR